jgi:hypothetical protein
MFELLRERRSPFKASVKPLVGAAAESELLDDVAAVSDACRELPAGRRNTVGRRRPGYCSLARRDGLNARIDDRLAFRTSPSCP